MYQTVEHHIVPSIFPLKKLCSHFKKMNIFKNIGNSHYAPSTITFPPKNTMKKLSSKLTSRPYYSSGLEDEWNHKKLVIFRVNKFTCQTIMIIPTTCPFMKQIKTPLSFPYMSQNMYIISWLLPLGLPEAPIHIPSYSIRVLWNSRNSHCCHYISMNKYDEDTQKQ